MIEAILFDFDGVLVDSEPVHYACWRDVLLPYGYQLEWDTYVHNCIGIADRAMVRRLCELAGREELFPRVWERYPAKKEMFRERMLASLPMPEATRELLRELNGYQLAVVSSSGRQEVEPPLVAAGVRDRFHALVCGEDVSEHKPSPEPYRLAARLLGVERALVVEDSEAGVASGQAAGFEVIRVAGAEETARLVRKRLGEWGSVGAHNFR